MRDTAWSAVDRYVETLFVGDDPGLAAATASSDAEGLPAIAVSAAQGKLLHLMARAMGARRVLEIGTLGGYSTIWLARALPADGTLITLELSEKHAAVARANLVRAGCGAVAEVRTGPALESLARLAAEGGEPFDFVFIDADKSGYTDYFRAALGLSRPGTLIVADNVVRNGAVTDEASADENVQAVRRFNAALAREPRVSATVLQTVGVKGYDGLAIALVQS